MNGVLPWLLALYVVEATFAGLQEEYKHYAVLDENEDVKLFWSVDSATEMINFEFLNRRATGHPRFDAIRQTGR